MTKKSLSLFEHFPSLQDSDSFFKKIIDQEKAGTRILNQLLLLLLFTFIYGLVMGAYHSTLQAVVAGLKVALLFTLALLICVPAFFIVQYILGSKLRLFQMISIVLSGFILMSAMMVSFLPIVVIFLLTGSDYYFLQLLHITIFTFSGIFGMNTIVKALKYSCENANVYPQTGVVVFRVWVVILAFVAIQLAWNFRPFLGDRGQPFEFVRQYEGNFYTALIYSIDKLIDRPDVKPQHKYQTEGKFQEADSLYIDKLLKGDNDGN